jgi:hypothetical protein
MMWFRPACVALCLSALSAISLWPRSASACSCLETVPPKEAAQHASIVFEGKVLGFEEIEPQPYVKLRAYQFEVLRQFKGNQAESFEVRTADNTASCGRPYAIGETYLVYAKERNGHLSDNLCSRSRTIADANEDLVFFGVAEPEPPPADPEPPRVDPEPDPPTPAPADEPPAPAPSSRGCMVGAAPDGWPLAWLGLAWVCTRRTRRP